jgi:prepilin-type N-terminal cleavage/methylation domain-containing protein
MIHLRHTFNDQALFESVGVPASGPCLSLISLSQRERAGVRENRSDKPPASVHRKGCGEGAFFNRQSPIANRKSRGGFTLIEMLTVITIIAIIAALAVPVLKNYGKSDVTVSASRQMLDDIGHARQLAMSQRTTVYMVFIPTNFWYSGGTPNSGWLGALSGAEEVAYTNLLDKQLTGYIDMAYGALGDQPGNHQWHYLTPWQSLPDGTYIPMWKFYNPNGTPAQPYFSFSDPVNANYNFNINPFPYTNTFPFPTEGATNIPSQYWPNLPYIAFNYLGQLSDYSGNLLLPQPLNGIGDGDFAGGGVDIPLAQGAVLPDIDQSTRSLTNGPPQVIEQPPGNSTNISYNVIHIDPLTGRATLEYHKMQ